ncbi:MAG: solute carrier family 34 (sodium-dependent phosphate cotransporter) [Candidatus Kentron sp. G]|nr:MAG: solute carrier family 34 (sodium-dependent phosphate cotransporter) [Candidatus Kentron sp. G]VFN04306.1 MAG: solute carrier family 34 (sodium-dependent phosphate cotransporter) [Candidatus Kentron sp. G]VFN05697.1 MAG: solute carrier family 34 (sodium-dependent phosphate cotransporter) [Candidatus Kentron sp. G]
MLIFLPLEIAFGLLEKISLFMASVILGGASLSLGGLNFVKPITKPVIGVFRDLFQTLPDPLGGVVLASLGVIVIFAAIGSLSRLLRNAMIGQARKTLLCAVNCGPMAGIASGTAVTVLVQSSSTTTSLMVPFAGAGLLNTREIYPFTLGANIGTCITSLLAATAISGPYAIFALQIALVHLMYNVLGVTIIYSIEFLRELPIKGAEFLAEMATERKSVVMAYVLGVFFIVPVLRLALFRG